MYETLVQRRHFLHEHFEDAATWGPPRTRALREHPRCGVIPGGGARWQEMRSPNRPTKYLSTRVAESAEQHCDSPNIFCLPLLRNDARHRSTTSPRGVPCVPAPRQSLGGCAVFALEPPIKEVLPEIEGTDVRDDKENLAVWGPRRYWDAITQGVAGGANKSCSTRGTRCHARLARPGCVPVFRKAGV